MVNCLPSSPVACVYLTLLGCLFGGVSPANVDAADRPNFIFFLVDDLGWADLGVQGSTFYDTPHIDTLARTGMRFTQAYAAGSVCSPTRASIMTGRHPVRVDITDWIPGRRARPQDKPRFQHVEDADHLALSEQTIAEVLLENGYRTFFAGKWHLGGPGFLPTDQGFEINVGGHEKGSPPGGYYAPWKNAYIAPKPDDEYLTERLTDESIEFITQSDRSQPFLLYLSYYNVHTPIQAYQKRVEQFEQRAAQLSPAEVPPRVERQGRSRMRQDNPAYASMVAAVDESVGRVLSVLEEQQLVNNTVIFFFSDNGGLCTVSRPGPTCNLPLRAGKGWLYEGGIREPLIIRAPGVTAPGSICDKPVTSMDFFPTMLQLAGLPLQANLHADGMSLLPLLRSKSQSQDRAFYWHYPHYHGSTWTPGAAVRQGDWKLLEFYEFDEVELYNLRDDPGEQHDLSQQYPERTEALRRQLRQWQQSLNARMPRPQDASD